MVTDSTSHPETTSASVSRLDVVYGSMEDVVYGRCTVCTLTQNNDKLPVQFRSFVPRYLLMCCTSSVKLLHYVMNLSFFHFAHITVAHIW